MISKSDYIPRKLTWIDKEQKQQVVEDRELVMKFSPPLVILGEPGMGKTWLMEELGELEAA